MFNSRRKILYIQYTNPAAYPSLEHSSRILAKAGWQVLFLGTGALGADILRFPPHPNITVRRLSFCPPGWRQKLHYVRFVLWSLAWTLRWRPAWVYASDPLSCPVALLLSYLPGIRVLYHEHDSPMPNDSMANNSISNHPISNLTPFMRFVFRCRRRLARRAELCVLPNEQRAKYFRRHVANGRSVVTVWNCPRREEVAQPRTLKMDGQLTLYYHGNISSGLLPLTVLKAMAMLPDRIRLRVIGYETVGYQGYVQTFLSTARQLGVADRVEFLGPIPRSQLMQHCQEGDVGLALMPMSSSSVNFRYMVGASNKPFDYLACGLALLVSDLPDWRAMYVEPGYGMACNPDNPESIAAALRWFLEHPAEMRGMGERGRQRILDEWNYERQFQKVLSRI